MFQTGSLLPIPGDFIEWGVVSAPRKSCILKPVCTMDPCERDVVWEHGSTWDCVGVLVPWGSMVCLSRLGSPAWILQIFFSFFRVTNDDNPTMEGLAKL
ncbi:hypothetical protein [Pasteuria penetrans]|uniref:hypothetical protein n=1 Tax=Pasteuria penetrans TaxID=86005 RepID=UPI0011EFBE4F|nr:hypothetical protein [Pasteuria penetrans]